MNREIEFRAWSPKNKTMSYAPIFDDSFMGMETPLNPTIKGIQNDETNPQILMQYTGQSDSNGKKIYEGDIVRQVRQDGCYGRGNFLCVETIGKPEYWELSDKGSGGPDGDKKILEQYVIGNIYENPDLLNK